MVKFTSLIDSFLVGQIDFDQFYSVFNDLYFSEHHDEENMQLEQKERDFLDEINEKMFFAGKEVSAEDRKYGYINEGEFRVWLKEEKDKNPAPWIYAEKLVELQKLLNETQDSLNAAAKAAGIELIDFSKYGPALKLCDAVAAEIAEFKDYPDFPLWGKENPGLHFGNFGRFLADQIEASGAESDVVKRCFKFVSDAYNQDLSEQKYIRAMLSTEVFENLPGSEKMVKTAKRYLQGQALEDFLQIVNYPTICKI